MLNLRYAAMALAMAATACNDNPPVEVPDDDPYLEISIVPGAGTFPVGGSFNFALVVTRGAAYNGTITLTVEGLPQNVTGTFVPATMPSPVIESALTISANAQATPGPCPFTVRASGPGVDPVVTQLVSCVVTAQ